MDDVTYDYLDDVILVVVYLFPFVLYFKIPEKIFYFEIDELPVKAWGNSSGSEKEKKKVWNLLRVKYKTEKWEDQKFDN